MVGLFKLLSVDQAWKLIRANLKISQPPSEVKPLLQCLGRIAAQDIMSTINVPGFNRSTMDGYAVRACDTFGASEAMPAILKIAGEVLMGQEANVSAGPGQAVQIPTGGMLPEGADSVLMIEYTEQLDDRTILVTKPVAPGENIILQGEDISAGDVLISAGTTIRPQDMGAMAGVGITSCQVVRRPKVAIISTGDEIVDPGEEAGPGQVRDINTYTVSGMVVQAGGEPVPYGIIKDEFDLLKAAIDRALTETDIVVVSGGSSVGTRDVTSEVLNTLGQPGVLVHGVAVKPGKPTILGVVNNKPVIGLPGHPASAMVLGDIFLIPLIRVLSGLGYTSPPRTKIPAVMGRSMPSASGRLDYLRVMLKENEGCLTAEPILGKSGLITTMSRAEGFVIIPMAKEGLEAGEEVEVILF